MAWHHVMLPSTCCDAVALVSAGFDVCDACCCFIHHHAVWCRVASALVRQKAYQPSLEASLKLQRQQLWQQQMPSSRSRRRTSTASSSEINAAMVRPLKPSVMRAGHGAPKHSSVALTHALDTCMGLPAVSLHCASIRHRVWSSCAAQQHCLRYFADW